MTHAIEIQDLSKRYRIGRLQHTVTFREQLVELVKHPFNLGRDEGEAIWALQNVSFRADDGEVVGILGRNGAGKSTLLKVLSKITYPTSGKVTVRGRIASLLEVGTGFHEELTGRENVYLNGSILGMKKREIEQHFDAIVDFAGVEKFIDTPIKRYSSGMRLRLGFAVAAHLDPDVLVVDEVLAVGDVGFQKKCIKAMEGLRSGGRTVLFVSHNLAAVENLCSRAVWLEAGQVRMDGSAKEVIEAYMATFAGGEAAGSEITDGESRVGSGEIRYTRLEKLTADGQPREMVRSGDSLTLRFHFHAAKAISHPSFGLRLFSEMGTLITETGNLLNGLDVRKVEPGDGYIDLEIDSLNLLPARYHLSLWITDPTGTPVYDGDARTMLEVEPANIYASGRTPDSRFGIVYFPQRWKIAASMKQVAVA